MKKTYKLILLLALVLSITGCAAMSAWTQAQADCASDPKCLEQTKSYAKVGEAVASGFGPVASGAAGAVITFIALGVLGLKKKKETPK
jgi:hypothetical protein